MTGTRNKTSSTYECIVDKRLKGKEYLVTDSVINALFNVTGVCGHDSTKSRQVRVETFEKDQKLSYID